MDHVDTDAVDPLTLQVHTGADGEFDIYEDAGEGPEYCDGEYAWTSIAYEDEPATAAGELTIGAADGSYPGQLATRGYRIEFVNADRSDWVAVDGSRLDETDSDPDGGECVV